MAQMNLIVTPQFEAALERIMRRRGFANKSEAVRAVVEEAAGEATADEVRAVRVAALDAMTGAWVGQGPDLPRKEDGSVDWGALKDEIYEGMP